MHQFTQLTISLSAFVLFHVLLLNMALKTNIINKLISSPGFRLSIKINLNRRCISSLNSSVDDLTPITPLNPTQSTSSLQSALQPRIIQKKIIDCDLVNLDISPPKEAWVQSFLTNEKIAIIDLHPLVFGTFPRCDSISKNVEWQKAYRKVDHLCLKTRAEMRGGGKKPWPQKGTGRARAGSIRAPQFVNGGWCHPPRGPTNNFYMLNYFIRVNGLTSTLTAKLAQNDLKIVDSFEGLPFDQSENMEKFCDDRGWGPSVLFVDSNDVFPTNISLATDTINHLNLMPVYGLNVYSMLKHETLVLTFDAIKEIEEKILFQFRRSDLRYVNRRVSPMRLFYI